MDNPNVSKKLLSLLQTGQITQYQLQRACAKWMLHPICWNNLQPKEFPIKTPEVDKHEGIPTSDRKSLDSTYYSDKPQILQYCIERSKYFWNNFHRLKQLKEFKEYIKENSETLNKYEQKINRFTQTVSLQGGELGMRKYVYKNEQVENVATQFGGRVV